MRLISLLVGAAHVGVSVSSVQPHHACPSGWEHLQPHELFEMRHQYAALWALRVNLKAALESSAPDELLREALRARCNGGGIKPEHPDEAKAHQTSVSISSVFKNENCSAAAAPSLNPPPPPYYLYGSRVLREVVQFCGAVGCASTAAAIPMVDTCYARRLLQNWDTIQPYIHQVPGGQGLGDQLVNHYLAAFPQVVNAGLPIVLLDGPVVSAMCAAFDCGFPVFAGEALRSYARRPLGSCGRAAQTSNNPTPPQPPQPRCRYSWSDAGYWHKIRQSRNPEDRPFGAASWALRLLLPKLSQRGLRSLVPQLLSEEGGGGGGGFFVGTRAGRSALLRLARFHEHPDEAVNFRVLHLRMYPPHVEANPAMGRDNPAVSEWLAHIEDHVTNAVDPNTPHRAGMTEPLNLAKALPEDIVRLIVENKGTASAAEAEAAAAATEPPPLLFCASDSVEACQFIHKRLAGHGVDLHFFNITPVHVKHVVVAQEEGEKHLQHDSLESFATFFTFLIMSRAKELYTTGSDFARSARLFGHQGWTSRDDSSGGGVFRYNTTDGGAAVYYGEGDLPSSTTNTTTTTTPLERPPDRLAVV